MTPQELSRLWQDIEAEKVVLRTKIGDLDAKIAALTAEVHALDAVIRELEQELEYLGGRLEADAGENIMGDASQYHCGVSSMRSRWPRPVVATYAWSTTAWQARTRTRQLQQPPINATGPSPLPSINPRRAQMTTNTASARIVVARAADTGPEWRLRCLVTCPELPPLARSDWHRRVVADLARSAPDFPPLRVSHPDRDHQRTLLVLSPLEERALWRAIGRLGRLLEPHVPFFARLQLDIAYD